MRILFFSQYFVPEVTALRLRAEAFAAGLAARGHEVEVIAEVPNHPTGIVHPGYGKRWVDRRRLDGYGVSYVKVVTSPEKTTRTRLLLYGSYAAASAAAAAVGRRPDVILATSPPLPTAAAAAMAAARHRVGWVMDVRDLWPEAAVVLGELRGERAIRAAEWLERRLYESAAEIITVTEPFRKVIAAKAGRTRIEVIPNGTTQAWIDAGRAPSDRAAAGFDEGRFVWMYGGNFGIAQGLEHAVAAAGLLGPDFKLVLLGGGPERERLAALAAELPEGLVEFREPVQPEVAAGLLRAADALLVSLGTAPELAKFVPSKLFDCCALGRPVILAASGEAPRLVAEHGAADIVAPGDAQALAGAVRRLRDDNDHAAALAAAGPEFAEQVRRERQIERLETVLARAARLRR